MGGGSLNGEGLLGRRGMVGHAAPPSRFPHSDLWEARVTVVVLYLLATVALAVGAAASAPEHGE